MSVLYTTKGYILPILHVSFRPAEFCSSSGLLHLFLIRLPGYRSNLYLEWALLWAASRSKILNWTMQLYWNLLLQHGIHHVPSDYTAQTCQWDKKVFATYTVAPQSTWQRLVPDCITSLCYSLRPWNEYNIPAFTARVSNMRIYLQHLVKKTMHPWAMKAQGSCFLLGEFPFYDMLPPRTLLFTVLLNRLYENELPLMCWS